MVEDFPSGRKHACQTINQLIINFVLYNSFLFQVIKNGSYSPFQVACPALKTRDSKTLHGYSNNISNICLIVLNFDTTFLEPRLNQVILV